MPHTNVKNKKTNGRKPKLPGDPDDMTRLWVGSLCAELFYNECEAAIDSASPTSELRKEAKALRDAGRWEKKPFTQRERQQLLEKNDIYALLTPEACSNIVRVQDALRRQQNLTTQESIDKVLNRKQELERLRDTQRWQFARDNSEVELRKLELRAEQLPRKAAPPCEWLHITVGMSRGRNGAGPTVVLPRGIIGRIKRDVQAAIRKEHRVTMSLDWIADSWAEFKALENSLRHSED